MKKNSKVFWKEGYNTADSQTILEEMKNIIGKTKTKDFQLLCALLAADVYRDLRYARAAGRRKGMLRKSSGINLMD